MGKPTKAQKIAHVARLFSAGEKYNACQLADAYKLKPEDWPDGMAEHRAGMRRELK